MLVSTTWVSLQTHRGAVPGDRKLPLLVAGLGAAIGDWTHEIPCTGAGERIGGSIVSPRLGVRGPTVLLSTGEEGWCNSPFVGLSQNDTGRETVVVDRDLDPFDGTDVFVRVLTVSAKTNPFVEEPSIRK